MRYSAAPGGSIMDVLPNLRRCLRAGGLGLLGALALHAPPFDIAQRLELALFDLWSRAGPPAPDELLL
ncbi:MAG TPA: hypothetical protein VFO94_06615, partial [Gammaproteobacteria bacterium]|nr:hypothetical protein [Gammaproteobacteria bacterium]